MPILTKQPQVKELLKDFQNTSAKSSDYVPKLKKLWAVLKEHIGEEESDDLPKLEKAMREADHDSRELAKNFGRTKAFVPSRSHPAAGEVRRQNNILSHKSCADIHSSRTHT